MDILTSRGQNVEYRILSYSLINQIILRVGFEALQNVFGFHGDDIIGRVSTYIYERAENIRGERGGGKSGFVLYCIAGGVVMSREVGTGCKGKGVKGVGR